MAFATTEDVGARLGRALTAGEESSVELLLDGATAVIAETAGKDDDWATDLSPVPSMLRFLAVELTCRALANPNALDRLQEQVGSTSYSAAFRTDGGGLLLTKTEELLVRRVVHGRTSGSARVESVTSDFYGS